MEIKEALRLKEQLEHDLYSLVKLYESATGTTITDIRIQKADEIGTAKPITIRITLEVQLL